MIPDPRATIRFAAIAIGVYATATVCLGGSPKNSKIDHLFAEWDRPGSPGMAVVIVKDGKIIYDQGYGSANLEHRVPITPQTVFDVASVAKQFTGLGIAMLVEQGKLSLDDDIRKHLPEVPPFGKSITIGHLLHHTSGLRDWPETLTLSGVDMEGAITLDMILEMVRRQRELDFSPGEEHLYSNTGYNLLAAAIAKVTAQSFRAWSDKNLFRPLGMKHTQVRDDPAEIVAGLAESYARSGPGQFRRVQSELAAQGSSSLLVSAEDMGKWLLNFETGQAGGKNAIKLMQQPGALNDGAKVSYGFGISLGNYKGKATLTHSGSWAGYSSFLIWIPDQRFGVAILANVANADTHGLAMKITDLYSGDATAATAKSSSKNSTAKQTTESKTKPDPESWDHFLGTYRLGPGWLLTITREDAQLMTQATNEDKFKMRPVSANTFFVDAYGAAIEFVRADSGAVNSLLYRSIKAPKLTLPQLSPDQLASYTGDYWSEELQVLGRFEIHNQKLALRDRSGNWVSLLPTAANRFDTDRGQFSVEFDCGPDTKPTQLKVSGGRVRNLRYQRVNLGPIVETAEIRSREEFECQ